MPRNMRAHEVEKAAKSKRSYALRREELRQPTVPREPAAGPVAMAVKVVDPETKRLIADFLAQKAPTECPWCKTNHSGACSRLISGGQWD